MTKVYLKCKEILEAKGFDMSRTVAYVSDSGRSIEFRCEGKKYRSRLSYSTLGISTYKQSLRLKNDIKKNVDEQIKSTVKNQLVVVKHSNIKNYKDATEYGRGLIKIRNRANYLLGELIELVCNNFATSVADFGSQLGLTPDAAYNLKCNYKICKRLGLDRETPMKRINMMRKDGRLRAGMSDKELEGAYKAPPTLDFRLNFYLSKTENYILNNKNLLENKKYKKRIKEFCDNLSNSLEL